MILSPSSAIIKNPTERSTKSEILKIIMVKRTIYATTSSIETVLGVMLILTTYAALESTGSRKRRAAFKLKNKMMVLLPTLMKKTVHTRDHIPVEMGYAPPADPSTIQSLLTSIMNLVTGNNVLKEHISDALNASAEI